jgi:hypothetical protein
MEPEYGTNPNKTCGPLRAISDSAAGTVGGKPDTVSEDGNSGSVPKDRDLKLADAEA